MSGNYPVIGSLDAGYLFEFKPDAIYLTVYPSPQFELADMRQILRDCGVVDYDVAVLSRTLREANGLPHKIADSIDLTEEQLQRILASDVPPDEAYATLLFDVSKDKMKVTVRYDTKGGSRLPTAQMVKEQLEEKGITYGVDEEAIEEGVKSLIPFVAAQGDPPVPGENAYIDRKYDLGRQGKPVVGEYDRVDYKNLNLFKLAKKNDTLAIRIPQTQGTPGKNVYGEVVPAQNGRPIPMPSGKNTQVIGEHQLIATINGQIVDTGTKISVDPRLEIKSSVGAGTGDIDFDGAVDISGDVKDGFKVKATGDINIKGSVSGGEVNGRNVFIGGGITGLDRGKVTAQDDVRATFAENAEVNAGRDIFIADMALHSTLRAAGKIIVEEKKGVITGGLAIAADEVRAKVIGNSAYVVTRVSVGVDPNLQKQYHDACAEYKDLKKRLLSITQTLNTLGKLDLSSLPAARLAKLQQLTRAQFPVAGQLKRSEALILELEARLSQMKQGKVKASDVMYPGVRLSVNGVVKNIQAEFRNCCFSLGEDGNVSLEPI